MATRKCENINLNVGAYANGVIPHKVSELENDVPYVTQKELDDIIGIAGDPTQDPLLVRMSASLTTEQKKQVRTNLEITDFVAEAVSYSEITWD